MKSNHLNDLESRVQVLRNVFLPSQWDPLGNYTEDEREKAAAFTVMAHAEIENFLENRVATYVDIHESRWITAETTHRALLSFIQVAFVDAHRQSTESDPSIDHIIRLGVRMIKERIRSNHGIKEKNLQQLLPAVGIDLSELPAGLVQTMNSLGSTRGSYAHKSGITRRLVNPQDEFNNVQAIVQQLSKLDELTQS